MGKLFIEESTLSSIGNAIRNKTGKSELLSPASMPTEIEGIQTGGEIPELIFTGDCSHACNHGMWNALFPYVKTQDITSGYYMFYNNQGDGKAFTIPFEINFKEGTTANVNYMFQNSNITHCPKMNNLYIGGELPNVFSGCSYLNDDIDTKMVISGVTRPITNSATQLFNDCMCLRKAPMNLINAINKNFTGKYNFYSPAQYQFQNCQVLDEVIGYYPFDVALTSNYFNGTFNSCARLKDFIFELDENGQPYVRNWSNQTIDLSSYLGWQYSDITNYSKYNGGITNDFRVNDEATYAALKDTDNWFGTRAEYSRYNHDSAVNTINSLPDCSQGSSNVIKFKGIAGSNTDGGAINTLTEEEIAVAAAKGWTVTLV